MRELLFLAHRIPYPPDKGDKIRSWNIFKFLAQRFAVHLGCFVDDPNDRQYEGELRAMCADALFAPLNPTAAKIASLRGFATGEALSLGYYRDRAMARWTAGRLAGGKIGGVFLYSSPMAQFVPLGDDQKPTVMDFVDIDSDKWRQFAETKRWPLSAVYKREAARLFDFERRVAKAVSASLFVSPAEAQMFRAMAPESADKIHHLNNGVDYDYFSPERPYDNPYSDAAPCLVFTGAMDYWANVDAVVWFAEEVFPAVRAAEPRARFIIVGGKPAAAVQALASMPGVEVTGRVPDVRPYVAHAAMAVAPLRIARGVQNKVLEAMAMEKPVVATSQAAEGIDAKAGAELLVADDAEGFAQTVIDVLRGKADPGIGARARRRIVASYDWSAGLKLLETLFEDKGTH